MPVVNKNSLARRSKSDFTQDYKMGVFMSWYNHGKPSLERFYALMITEGMKEPLSGDFPSKVTVSKWIKEDFELKATFLDNEAAKDIEKKLVANKIEILQKHAKVGNELYEMGMEYLRENGIGSARNALTAVIEGIRIEAENSGASIRFSELSKMSDEELLGEFTKLVQGSKIVSISPNDE